MLHPSYSELMEIVNKDTDLDNRITSRYTIVIAAARRARQLIDLKIATSGLPGGDKAVSMAVDEIYNGKILIKTYNDDIPTLNDDMLNYFENN